MARQPRLDLAGIPQHIVHRGNNRAAIFRDAGDTSYFHHLIGASARDHAVALHAYVLMDNHVHLLATPAEDGGIGRMMQAIGRRYVPYFNQRHGRTGALWEGRYRATLIEADDYLFACQRYIEMNPVRAGLVARPRDFTRSSHRHYAGLTCDGALTPHALIVALGTTGEARTRAYLQLFERQLDPQLVDTLRDRTHKGWALGSQQFIDRLTRTSGCRAVPAARGGDRRSRRARRINRV